MIVDCIGGYLWDAELEKCVEFVPPVLIHCVLGYVHGDDGCEFVGCPRTHFLDDDGFCVPFDFDLDLEGPIRINPDLLPDLDPALLDPAFPIDPRRFDLGLLDP